MFESLQFFLDLNLQLHSRIHSLQSIGNSNNLCFIKRDDELSCTVSGSKLRKYASLIKALQDQKVKQAIVIGSSHSNHVLGFSQLLIENRIKPILFLKNSHDLAIKGNFFLIQLLVPKKDIYFFTNKEWQSIEQIAQLHVEQDSLPTKIIPEGAFMEEALPGAMTLAFDIFANEKKENLSFDHLWLDAGSGLTAIAAILVYAFYQRNTKIHIVLLADTKEIFINKLQQNHIIAEKLFNTFIPFSSKFIEENLVFHQPFTAKSFGSTNSTLNQWIKEFARNEGFFLDPLYSAKLVGTAHHFMETHTMSGYHLIVHSGGILSLLGFKEAYKMDL
jgi:1-aminocyclopropane-1-carboxylate deaminase